MSLLRNVVCAGLMLAVVAPAHGMIQFGLDGVDVGYLGASGILSTSGSADDLISISISQNGVVLVDDSTDVSLDLRIPGITGMVNNAVNSVATGPNGHLTIEFDAGGVEELTLNLAAGSVTFIPGGFISFVFTANAATIGSQNLPNGIVIAEPVNVSFSLQALSSNVTVGGGNVITGMTATGTGDITALPEPATLAMIGLGGLLMIYRRR